MNTKLHAVTDAHGRPIRFFMTAGQVSDYTGAAALLEGFTYSSCSSRTPCQDRPSRSCSLGVLQHLRQLTPVWLGLLGHKGLQPRPESSRSGTAS